MNKINSIAVFCGSSSGNNPEYEKQAYNLGKFLALNKITMVYGGGSRGIMGACAKGCHDNAGYVIGIIPKFLYELPIVKTGLYENEVIVTEDMHSRKQKMCEKADAFIALPGGIGTFEEILEQMAWLQLRLHNKPCGFFNINGFYDSLEKFLNESSEAGFTKKAVLETICFEKKPEDLIKALQEIEINLPPKNG